MNIKDVNDETTYKLFRTMDGSVAREPWTAEAAKAIEESPTSSQRRLAAELEMSLGKLNYCLKALLGKGLVRVENFMASNNKRGYLYKLTPAGMSEKARVTLRFLRCKEDEFDALTQQLSELRAEAKKVDS